jgi:hypothetical protein
MLASSYQLALYKRSGDRSTDQRDQELTLIDLEKLVDLSIEHFDKVSEPDKKLLPLRPIHYLAPVE